jgi:hypothetical protein
MLVFSLPRTVAAQLGRDAGVMLAAYLAMFRELRWIEMVDCPGCWPRPGKYCLDLAARGVSRPGATPRYNLPRMYHEERRLRAIHKVGFPA